MEKTFKYQAKDQKGKIIKGKIEALDAQAAVKLLHEKGLVVVKISPVVNLNLISSLQKINLAELARFTRQLSTMLAVGLPLTDALGNLEKQANENFGRVVAMIRRDVTAGVSVSVAMSKSPQYFSSLYLSMVRAGETSGKLEITMGKLADNLDRQEEFQSKIKGALVYPAIVVVVMGLVATAMLILVVPQISAVYEQFGSELPLPTKILVGLSKLITDYGIFLAAALAGGFFLMQNLKKNPTVDYALQNFYLKLPAVGEMWTNATLGITARTLGILVGSGVSIIEALKIVSQVVGNNVYRTGILRAANTVEKGFPFSMSIKANENFPVVFAQMAAIGEETGTLDKSLEQTAGFFEVAAERQAKALTTTLEPVLTVVMGIGVAGLAIAILLPMFNMVNVIK